MNGKTIVIFLVGLVIVGIGGYYLGNRSKPATQNVGITPEVTQQQIALSQTAKVTPTPQATIDETDILKSAVRQALVAEHGNSANELTITITTIQGNYAKGMASASAGGGLWFSAKVLDTWKLVWDGNGIVQCDTITQYPDFPASLIPECWDTALNKNVTR